MARGYHIIIIVIIRVKPNTFYSWAKFGLLFFRHTKTTRQSHRPHTQAKGGGGREAVCYEMSISK